MNLGTSFSTGLERNVRRLTAFETWDPLGTTRSHGVQIALSSIRYFSLLGFQRMSYKMYKAFRESKSSAGEAAG